MPIRAATGTAAVGLANVNRRCSVRAVITTLPTVRSIRRELRELADESPGRLGQVQRPSGRSRDELDDTLDMRRHPSHDLIHVLRIGQELGLLPC